LWAFESAISPFVIVSFAAALGMAVTYVLGVVGFGVLDILDIILLITKILLGSLSSLV